MIHLCHILQSKDHLRHFISLLNKLMICLNEQNILLEWDPICGMIWLTTVKLIQFYDRIVLPTKQCWCNARWNYEKCVSSLIESRCNIFIHLNQIHFLFYHPLWVLTHLKNLFYYINVAIFKTNGGSWMQ